MPIRRAPPVDLLEHLLDGRLVVRAFGPIVPPQGVQTFVPAAARAPRLVLEPRPEVIDEPRFATRVARGVHSLFVPLQQPLGVREAALLLRVAGCGEEK